MNKAFFLNSKPKNQNTYAIQQGAKSEVYLTSQIQLNFPPLKVKAHFLLLVSLSICLSRTLWKTFARISHSRQDSYENLAWIQLFNTISIVVFHRQCANMISSFFLKKSSNVKISRKQVTCSNRKKKFKSAIRTSYLLMSVYRSFRLMFKIFFH